MKTPNNGTLKLVMIKTKTNSYISDNIKNEGYHHTELSKLVIDGEQLESTYNKDWFKIKDVPTKIEKMKPSQKINQRYELKEGYPESELTPKVVSSGDFYDKYEDVSGLYTYKYDEVEGELEEIEFEVNVIEELEIEFEMKRMDYTPQYDFLDKIQTHPILLPAKRCTLSAKQSYEIIRNHIKSNIDSRYARVTSDYDFCLTVKKVIELYEPKSYQINLNAGHSRRKPKYETRFKTNKELTIFEVAPKVYNDYTVVTPFTGDNYDDLLNNIEKYLNELMNKINEPLKECECCKGNGVILNDNN